MNFIAKKSLGQNFIHAPHVISAMIHASDIKNDDHVLEIGPGKGVLTEKILEIGAKLIAVEKDDRAIPFLQDKFKEAIQNGQLSLIHDDALTFDPGKNGLISGQYTIITNLPYYISGEFLRKYLEIEVKPKKIVVMLQKEVAKRIVDSKESILSLSVKAFGQPKYIVSVPRKFFRPMPNVDSAVISIDNINDNMFKEGNIDVKKYFEIIKMGFSHKRKVLIKNLEELIPKDILKSIWERENIPLNIRAEDLSPEMWKKIVGNC